MKANSIFNSKEILFFESQRFSKKEINASLLKGISNIIANKYNSSSKNYNHALIESLINNKNCHAVSNLKDHMIYDFIDEFLKR